MHYYNFNIADFALHTSHLTLEEEGVYRRLLDYYYDTETPIPKETQPVIRRLRLVSYAEMVEAILAEFFVLESDGWHNLRADIEIALYKTKADQARENGLKGGRPKKNNPAITNPVISANPEETGSQANHELGTSNQEPVTNTTGSPAIADKPPSDTDQQFDLIWKAYPKREGSNPKNKALSGYRARIKEGISPDLMAAGVERYYRYCQAKGTIGTEYVMQAQRFFGKEKAFENDWIITENDNAAHQQRFTKQSKSDRDDEAMRKYLAENSDDGGNDKNMANAPGMETGPFGSRQH